jgi:hypothetical protein
MKTEVMPPIYYKPNPRAKQKAEDKLDGQNGESNTVKQQSGSA